MKTLREMMDLIESAQTVDLTEGIMDVIKQTFNDNVVGWPMGTSDEQFIQGWARDIKDRTGVDVPTAKLVQLYNHYTKRSPELMQTHSTTNEQGVVEADETSWTANSAQFRKEEDMSWTVEVTLEPRADINQGRGRQVKTQTVSAQSRDAAKKKLADYYRKNGWEVTGIKFVSDLAEGEDKVRQVNDAEYYHLKLLAKEAGITLTGMGADKVTGDLHWQGDTRDGRRVSGTVKKVIDDNGEYIQGVAEEQLEETETDPIRRIEELFRNK